jgi:hypothetical protein
MTRTNTLTGVPCGDREGPTTGPVPASIPRGGEVLRSCTATSDEARRHPLLDAARALAALHEQRAEAHQLTGDPMAEDPQLAGAARTMAATDTGRAVLIDRIDHWAYAVLPDERHAAVHTESLGQLIDRMIGTWARWHAVKNCADPAGTERASTLLHHVSELSIGYDDLIADVLAGRRRLPHHNNPIAA